MGLSQFFILLFIMIIPVTNRYAPNGGNRIKNASANRAKDMPIGVNVASKLPKTIAHAKAQKSSVAPTTNRV